MKSLIPLVIAMTLALIAFSMVFPLLPYMLKQHGVSEFKQVAIFSVFSAFSFISAPLWGRASDKIGRKPIILLTLLGSAGCCLWLYFSDSAIDIYINRAAAGIFAGWITAGQATIADNVSKQNRTRGMAMMGIAFGLGFTIGPLLSALLIENWQNNQQFFQTPIIYMLIFFALSMLCIALTLKQPSKKNSGGEDDSESSKLSPIQVLSQPVILQGLLLIMFFQLVFTALESTLALWVYDRFSGGPQEVGKLLGFAGFVTLLAHGSIVTRLGRRYSEMHLAVSGIVFLAVALVSLAWIGNQAQAYISIGFIAVGHALFIPACTAFLSRLAPQDWQGGIMGFIQSGNSLARIGGPAGGGYLYALLGSMWTYPVLLIPLLPPFIIAISLMRRNKRAEYNS